MKFTLSWLKDHLETEASLDEIAHALSMLGLEVEGIENPAEDLAPFTAAHVKEAKPHPNADRLKVCIVETAEHGTVQVVCGAPNARTGMKGVFAPVGTHIPGTGLDLKKGKIRGEESEGMLVSEREMGLSDEHEGIIELPEDTAVGTPLSEILGLDDPVIDIAITPNRGDCLGVRGVARDLAAAGLGTLKPFETPQIAGRFESPVKWTRDLPADKQDACPFVGGRYFKGVANGPSPDWMQARLKAIGLRPISALVDITNYVTFDLGRPLHVFDADKLSGDLVMRMAEPGEEILALDERSYTPDTETVVIADSERLHGIGGIMGGEESGVTEETTNVFLEVALFDPVRVAASGRKLGILSDARYRFERTVDPASADWGVAVASDLILKLCGGEASEATTAGEPPLEARRLTLRPSRVESLGGIALEPGRQEEILKALGFETRHADGMIEARVPTWRPDVEGEACLIEEVLRIHGYDAIPVTPMPRESTISTAILTRLQQRQEAARRAYAWRGLDETVTFSFLASALAKAFGGVKESLHLVNPISADLDVMRPSLIANLAEAAQRNADKGLGDALLFEVGPEYRDDTPEGQVEVAAGLRFGNAVPRNWFGSARAVDLFDAKGDALAVLEACGAPVDNLQVTRDAPGWYHPGRSGVFRLGPKVLAAFGELHPRVLKALDSRGPMVASEVYLEEIPAPRKETKLRPALEASAFQPVTRDFAFLVDADVAAEQILRAAKGAEKDLVSGVRVFDRYAGEGLAENKISIAIEVTLQPRQKTLTEEDIAQVSKQIVAAVEKATGGSLRG